METDQLTEKKPRKGHPISEETKEKIRRALTGKKHDASAIEKMRQAKIGKKRGPHSEETKKKMSEAQKGCEKPPMTDETKKKISEALKKFKEKKNAQ